MFRYDLVNYVLTKSGNMTDNWTAGISIKQTLSFFQRSNVFCNLPIKADTSSFEDEFLLSNKKLLFPCKIFTWLQWSIFVPIRTYQTTISYTFSLFSWMSMFSKTSLRRTRLYDGHFSLSQSVPVLRGSTVYRNFCRDNRGQIKKNQIKRIYLWCASQ